MNFNRPYRISRCDPRLVVRLVRAGRPNVQGQQEWICRIIRGVKGKKNHAVGNPAYALQSELLPE